MHGFWAHEPACKLTENQREIARRILLGDWGEFPRENDDENRAENTRETASETGVETATKAGPFPTREAPSRRSENLVTFNVPATLDIQPDGQGNYLFTIAVQVLGYRYTVRELMSRDQVGELRAKLERHVAALEAADAAAEGGAA